MTTIDLRSDTVTLPTPAMRRGHGGGRGGRRRIRRGPDYLRLERMAAERMGKEAAMLVSSGTMANLVCLLTHCGTGR